MSPQRPHAWSNPWVRWSVGGLVALTVLSVLAGFVLLPAVKSDFTAQGLWDSICRTAGLPSSWGGASAVKTGPATTEVVLARSMAAAPPAASVGRGGTLALNCTMCHGARGLSASDAPNLAGQYPEVIVKQLMDYRSGHRRSAVMEALARGLSEQDIADLAAYYAYLPKARTAPTTYDESLPALVRVGAPLRNIAPCISCHGGIDQKFGAPWLEGMPAHYLVQQLQAFRSGARRNDGEAQMRNVARAMTDQEIAEVAAFYARKASAGEEK
ncbi:c-type cytochrome [Xylophilus sp.]|uniref:c-type cytochrome n=1 Tax=Xylophilus sp. TaxID=2653893 RepID=UPI0013B9AB15|nr:c-type cytochrome [Xylophilus sp.]KAF1045023.1 MAG: Cytochrome c4 [Xylophilus sp.]